MNTLLFLFSLSLLLLLHNASSIDPLFSSCSNPNNYTSHDPFSKNLNQLGFQLTTNSPCTGFALGSIGRGSTKVNGLALCRGDVNATTCEACVRTANAQIHQLCPFKKQAVIFFDECLLSYSDVEFFGEIDGAYKLLLVNTQNVTSLKTELFNSEVVKLMSLLKTEAYLSPVLFASGAADIGDSYLEKLYGLVQCSRDLASEDCKNCLEGAVDELLSFSKGKRGGRVAGGSCSVRYELYPFFNS